MTQERYLPRFAGIKTFMGLPHTQDPSLLKDYDAAVIGLPFDTGASYRVGTRFAPGAIREMTALVREYNPALGISPLDVLRVVDYGDSIVVPGNTAASMELMEQSVKQLAEMNIIPLSLGGDHLVSLPALRALAAVHGPLSLIHFDSHPDTWTELFGDAYNHATPFRRALEEELIVPQRSIQLGIRGSVPGPEDLALTRSLGFTVVEARDLLDMDPRDVHQLVARTLGPGPAYLSFDIDFVDPAFAPGTGTPEIGGPTSAETLSFIRGLDLSGVVGLDIVEVLPPYDPSGITSLLGANLAFELLSVLALSRS